jgi:hypothetical protein
VAVKMEPLGSDHSKLAHDGRLTNLSLLHLIFLKCSDLELNGDTRLWL